MLTFETAQDVIELARQFHEQVSNLYLRLSDQADKERVTLLLRYMGRHEKHLAECLASYEHGPAARVLDTWLQFSPGDVPERVLAGIELKNDMSVDDVIETAVQLDNYMIDMYRRAAEEADSRELTELFCNLLEMERHEEIRLLRDALNVKEM